jgi:RHS repeat-associated protein
MNANDYYPFGMSMPGRKFSLNSNRYRYGFNGKENDKDISSEDLDYGARIYDCKLGIWLGIDPLYKKYPGESPYTFCGNNPILFKDIDGRDRIVTIIVIGLDGTTYHMKRTYKDIYHYQADARSNGAGYYTTRSHIAQTMVINLNSVLNNDGTLREEIDYSGFLNFSIEYQNPETISLGSYIFNAVFGLGKGNNSDKFQHGFRIFGNGKDTEWQSGLPFAEEGVEGIDLGKWLSFVGGLKDVEDFNGVWEHYLNALVINGKQFSAEFKALREAVNMIAHKSSKFIDATNSAVNAVTLVKEIKAKKIAESSSSSPIKTELTQPVIIKQPNVPIYSGGATPDNHTSSPQSVKTGRRGEPDTSYFTTEKNKRKNR